MQHLSEKTQFPCFPVFPGSAEALVMCGGKIKYILIAYFLGNICAKNCRNRAVYVKIIASCEGGTFFGIHLRLKPLGRSILNKTKQNVVASSDI